MFKFFRRKNLPDKALSLDQIFEEAIGLMSQIEDEGVKNWCRRDLAIALGASGRMIEAGKMTEEITNTDQKDLAYIGIGIRLIERGKYDEAREMEQFIEDDFNKNNFFYPTAKRQAQLSEYQLCTETIKAEISQSAPTGVSNTIIDCACIAYEKGDVEEAEKLFHLGLEHSDWSDSNEAVRLLYSGEDEKGLEKILSNAENSTSMAIGLAAYCRHACKMKKWELAKRIIGMINDSDWRDCALQDIAKALAETGDKEGAETFVKQIKNRREKEVGKRITSEGLAKYGAYQQAIEVAESIGTKYRQEQIYAFRDITLAQIANGDIDEAWETDKRIPVSEKRSVLEAFAKYYVQEGELTKAREVIDQVKVVMNKDSDCFYKASSLAHLGGLLFIYSETEA